MSRLRPVPLNLSLAYKYPAIAKQAFGWNPGETYARANVSKKWICDLGHIWSTSINNRVNENGGSNCPYCLGRKVWPGFNDLATTHPDLAKEVYNCDPTTISKGMMEKISWKCSKHGHIWNERISHRTNESTGCPYCSGRRVLVGFNDLMITHPKLAKEADGWDPTTVSRGTRKKMQWRCSNHGHIWSTSPRARTCLREGCPVCSGQRILAGFNDLATTYPELAKEAYNFDPTTISKGSSRKVQWQCNLCQNIWSATPGSRVYSEAGCPACAVTGFDPSQPSYLYMMCHPDWGLIQIGITNYPKDRLARHKKSGWKLLNLVHPISGTETRRIETVLKQWLRSEKIPMGHTPDGSKFDGYTESWPEEELLVSSIYELCQVAKISAQISKWDLVESIR